MVTVAFLNLVGHMNRKLISLDKKCTWICPGKLSFQKRAMGATKMVTIHWDGNFNNGHLFLRPFWQTSPWEMNESNPNIVKYCWYELCYDWVFLTISFSWSGFILILSRVLPLWYPSPNTCHNNFEVMLPSVEGSPLWEYFYPIKFEGWGLRNKSSSIVQ